MCELLKMFLRVMVDNKCANIFFTPEVDLSSKHLDTRKHITC